MSDPMIAPESFELKPVDRPWPLSVPRSFHGYSGLNDPTGYRTVPGASPDATRKHGSCSVSFAWFVRRSSQFAAVLFWSNTYQVVAGSRGHVRESVWVNPHQRYFEARIKRLNLKLKEAGLPGLADVDVVRNARKADLALALVVAGCVVRRLAATPLTPRKRAPRVSKEAEQWLRRQLDGLGEKVIPFRPGARRRRRAPGKTEITIGGD